jgi:hypothetical protein
VRLLIRLVDQPNSCCTRATGLVDNRCTICVSIAEPSKEFSWAVGLWVSSRGGLAPPLYHPSLPADAPRLTKMTGVQKLKVGGVGK